MRNICKEKLLRKEILLNVLLFEIAFCFLKFLKVVWYILWYFSTYSLIPSLYVEIRSWYYQTIFEILIWIMQAWHQFFSPPSAYFQSCREGTYTFTKYYDLELAICLVTLPHHSSWVPWRQITYPLLPRKYETDYATLMLFYRWWRVGNISSADLKYKLASLHNKINARIGQNIQKRLPIWNTTLFTGQQKGHTVKTQ